ncbi:MAG: hypothetical protein Q7R84_02035 [bacterium]|nr:hypothetical protein [bacterium]
MSIIEVAWLAVFLGFLLICFIIFQTIRGRKTRRDLFLSLWSESFYKTLEREHRERLEAWEKHKT